MMCSIDWLLIFTSVIVAVQADEERELFSRTAPRTKPCNSDSDCDVTMGYACYWLFDGCDVGQCMCNPRKHRRLASGRCLTVKFGGETCNGPFDVCIDGMRCTDGTCQCDAGVMTRDMQHCLRSSHKLVGQKCDLHFDTCFQRAANGYTRNDVSCSHRGTCECQDGTKSEGLTCRSLRIHETGCSKFFHCEGGAVCVDRKCVCPNGYSNSAHGSKCAKRDAIKDLGSGAECDEINEVSYCRYGLVCHRCTHADDQYKCVRFSFPTKAGLLSSRSSHPTYPSYSFVFLLAVVSAGSVVAGHSPSSTSFAEFVR